MTWSWKSWANRSQQAQDQKVSQDADFSDKTLTVPGNQDKQATPLPTDPVGPASHYNTAQSQEEWN